MKKALKIIGITWLVMAALILIVYMFDGSRNTATPTPSPTVSKQTKDEAYYARWWAEVGHNILDNAVPAGTKTDMRFDTETGYCYYDLIVPEINSTFIQNAKDGVGTCRSDWDHFKKSILSIQKSMQDFYTDIDESMIVIVDVLNPDNEDEVFLSVAQGVAGYDVVNGIDLLNRQNGQED